MNVAAPVGVGYRQHGPKSPKERLGGPAWHGDMRAGGAARPASICKSLGTCSAAEACLEVARDLLVAHPPLAPRPQLLGRQVALPLPAAQPRRQAACAPSLTLSAPGTLGPPELPATHLRRTHAHSSSPMRSSGTPNTCGPGRPNRRTLNPRTPSDESAGTRETLQARRASAWRPRHARAHTQPRCRHLHVCHCGVLVQKILNLSREQVLAACRHFVCEGSGQEGGGKKAGARPPARHPPCLRPLRPSC